MSSTSRAFTREDRPSLYCVELRTADWERSVEWYRHGLGLRVLVRVVEDGYALVEAGETRISILARERPGEPTRRMSRAFEEGDLQTVIDRLGRIGTRVKLAADNAEGLREATTTDPDGNRVRLFSWPSYS